MPSESELEALRKEVREITKEIIRLIGLRLSLAKKINEVKHSMGLPIIDFKVERDLKNFVIDACKKYNVDESFGLRLLNLLIDEAVRAQKISTDEGKKAISVIDMFVLAKKMEKEGSKIIHLEVGEPDFGPPEKVKRATYDAISKGYTHYTEPSGILNLRESIANSVSERYGIDLSPEQVAITSGGRFSVYASILSILSPGDEAIVIQPAWPAYVDCIESIGRAISIKTNLEDGWRPDIEFISNLINDSTKMIIINYPNNPTGKVLEKRDMKALVDLAMERNVTILSDEVYSNYSFKPFNSILEFHDCKSICVSSFSKSHGMTGFRIGYAISDVETIKKISRVQALASTSVPEFIQYAAIEALKCKNDVKRYANIIRERINLVCKALKKMNLSYYEPDGAFYVFPQLSKNRNFDAGKFALDLLNDKNVCVAPGITFGDYHNFIRISACQAEHLLLEGLRRMGGVLR
ncbi:MAG: aminotransferase class I/II-fold pyridoxal phosphate-dependent enzyme [archaeon]|nr:aminotransferase class I/II-fold pyridoxal phosphate-dependent enzyme [archaeon]MCP8319980.1 aminotransferase class I/II-fold pyridoxal phosphate-dependent enzyme [archaeon]